MKEFEFDILKYINQNIVSNNYSIIPYYGDYSQGTTYREMSIFIKLLYKQPVSYEIVKEEFEMSLSSFKRAIATLRGALENSSSLHGTIQYNSKRKTYYLVLSNSKIDTI